MRGGSRPGAGRHRCEEKKVRLCLYVKPETLDKYRTLRLHDAPILGHIEQAIDVEFLHLCVCEDLRE